MSFLAIPSYRLMQIYGLADHLIWAVIFVKVTFATLCAIFIFRQYRTSIPLQLDEAARVDGAMPWQVYWRIYLPLMAPAMVMVGTYALLLAWNGVPVSVPAAVVTAEHDGPRGNGVFPG